MNKNVEEIIRNFDFLRVKKVMDCLDWKWYFKDTPPSIGEIMIAAQNQLEEAIERKITLSSGGFKSTYYPKDECGDECVELEFIIESWDTFK